MNMPYAKAHTFETPSSSFEIIYNEIPPDVREIRLAHALTLTVEQIQAWLVQEA